MKNLSILFIAIVLLSACHKKKEDAPGPTCYQKSDIIGKVLKNYRVNNIVISPERTFIFGADSMTQETSKYPVTYTYGYDTAYVHYSSTAITKYFIEVNNCNEFTFTDGTYKTYLR